MQCTCEVWGPVLAGENQASIVELLHAAAHDAPPRHPALACHDVRSHNQLVLHPLPLRGVTRVSNTPLQRHLHHDPAPVALVNRQLAATAPVTSLESALVTAAAGVNAVASAAAAPLHAGDGPAASAENEGAPAAVLAGDECAAVRGCRS